MTSGNKYMDNQNMEKLKEKYRKVFSHAELKTVYVENEKNFETTVAALKDKLKLEPIKVNLGALKKVISEDLTGLKVFISDLCNKELKQNWTKKIRSIEELKLRFFDGMEYGVSVFWIDHLHEIQCKNLAKTVEVAVEDRVRRFVIRGIYAIRNNLKSFEKEFVQACYKCINFVVRQRNVAPEGIAFLKPANLKFELHWFTIDGAESFVEEVLKEVRLRPNGGQEEVQFITGRGFHSPDGRSSIKKQLLELYGKKIRVRQDNSGILLYSPMLQYNFLPRF